MDINKPRFELRSIFSDGSVEKPRVVPINEMPWDTNTDRRGFLGAGLVAGAALVLLSKCTPAKKSVSGKVTANNSNSGRNRKGTILYAHCGPVKMISISPDAKILVSASADKTLKIWSLPDGNLLQKVKLKASRRNVPAEAHALAITPNGKIIASAQDNYIKLWSLPNGDSLKTLKGHAYSVRALAVNPEGNLLVSGSSDYIIKLWSLPKGNLLNSLKGHSKQINSLFISSDGKILVSTSENGTNLWSLPGGNLLKTIEGTNPSLNKLLISPDSKMLFLSSSANTIRLYSLPDGNLLKTLSGHSNWVNTITISPDSKMLVTGSSDKTIKLWSLPDGVLIKTLQGNADSINSLSISPNGKLLASAFSNKIKLWSLPDGSSLETLDNKSSSFNTELMISQNGKMLISFSTSGKTICLYDLEKEEMTGLLFDPACNETDGITYNVYDKVAGVTRTYTLPCGSPVPAGAVCTCNCVPGTFVYKPPTYYRSSGTYCTCNTVCTCVPICQAHKLLHPDKFIRLMSREILLFMGVNEIEYMQWAADNSKTKLKTAIKSLIKKIKRGANPDQKRWPSIAECQQYLEHSEEVVSIMAAQMINLQHNIRKQPASQEIFQTVESLLVKSEQMHWKINQKNEHR